MSSGTFQRPSPDPNPQREAFQPIGDAGPGPYAFVGPSKIRSTSAMDGVPIADRRGGLKCGVAAVNLNRGELAGLLEFETAVEEIFDVQLLPDVRFPEVIGFQKESLHHTFVIPPESSVSQHP